MPALTAVFIIDPPERLDPPTDTSLALMRESLRRGQQVFYCTLAELRLVNESPSARVRPVVFPPGAELFAAGEERELDLATIDVLYMRKDPPVDAAYLHATYILDRLPPRVLQVNPAQALRRHCEKLIPLHLPGLLPETVVSRAARDLNDFLDRIGRIVLKPLDDCSGRGIFSLTRDDPNRRALIDQVTAAGSRYVQGQRFLPEIAEGDKRVLLLGGEILGWLRRVPAPGDFRSNVNAGGRCLPCELTDSDRAICARLGAWLSREGIVLAGADLVGQHVLEVNITSPSCLREMDDLTGERLERKIIDYVERRCRS
ncbi:MAG TPA: glutathione synthase [Desulfuromonadales bacterium]|nr:glutathione synthase [Desulfuromonadales bacterium]